MWGNQIIAVMLHSSGPYQSSRRNPNGDAGKIGKVAIELDRELLRRSIVVDIVSRNPGLCKEMSDGDDRVQGKISIFEP